jgi:prephenate dehydratase
MRVAYLGPEGTFSHEALLGLPGAASLTPAPQATIHACVLAVQSGEAERALVPLENSLEGSVRATLDALVFDAPAVTIAGEVLHPVHHCLIAREAVALDAIEVVRSHPQGTAQCAGFLRRELPRARVAPVASTAEAVRLVAETGDGAAIGFPGRRPALRRDRAARGGGGRGATRPLRLARAGRDGPLGRDRAREDAIVWWGAGRARPGGSCAACRSSPSRRQPTHRVAPRARPARGYMFFADPTAPTDGAGRGDRRRAGHATTVRVLARSRPR